MLRLRKIEITTLVLVLSVSFGGLAFAQTAPDATDMGPLSTTDAEYRFAASLDPDIIGDRLTEIWARVYRPEDMSKGTYPVVIFLHGNHATCGTGMNPRMDTNCQYTTLGNCPAGFVVVPNHEGYSYVAQRLASWGYFVVSINANRGITCGGGISGDAGLNLARGRLILRHLQRLSEWNTNGGTPDSLGVDLQGKLDFNSLGLMGHSRGGEGVRAAYNQYRDMGSPWPGRIPDPLNFQAIFEIGPVDGQTSRVLNADGTIWNVLLPMCDGDVSDLQGVKPFDRMMNIFNEAPATQKSTFTVWGANHNFYNTEWQQSDSPGCLGHMALFPDPEIIGSPPQRQTSLAGIMALMRGNVGPNADPTFNENFNPQFGLPPVVTDVTRVDRGYTDSPNSDITMRLEDFDRPTGTSTLGFPNNASNISISHGSVPNHAPTQRAGVISWTTAGAETYFQTNFAAEGESLDISAFVTLDLRLSRQSFGNPADPTNFSIQLAMADGTLSDPVQLNAYTDLRGPVGGVRGGLHPILQTARIALADFGKADLTQARGVRLTFDDTATGGIYVANIRLSYFSGLAPANFQSSGKFTSQSFDPLPSQDSANDVNVIKSIRTVALSQVLEGRAAAEMELNSNRAFAVRDELAKLHINGQEFGISRYSEDGNTNTIIFTLPLETFTQLRDGADVSVQYGSDEAAAWKFGPLNKSLANR